MTKEERSGSKLTGLNGRPLTAEEIARQEAAKKDRGRWRRFADAPQPSKKKQA